VAAVTIVQLAVLSAGAMIGRQLPEPTEVEPVHGTVELTLHNLQIGLAYFVVGLATFSVGSSLLALASSFFNGMNLGLFAATYGLGALAGALAHAPLEIAGASCFLVAGSGTLRAILRRADGLWVEMRTAIILNLAGTVLLVTGGVVETSRHSPV
jgi:hypothetical protein